MRVSSDSILSTPDLSLARSTPWWVVHTNTPSASLVLTAEEGHNPGVLVGEPAVWPRERIHGVDFSLHGLQAELVERDVKGAHKAVRRFVHGES